MATPTQSLHAMETLSRELLAAAARYLPGA